MKRQNRKRILFPVPEGFTILEMMVAMIVFSVGILGFVGMTMTMARGNRGAKFSNEAATLIQSTVEGLGAVTWDDLGTNTTLPALNGLVDAAILVEGPLSQAGDSIGTGSGPYVFSRYLVVCDDGDTTVNPGGGSSILWFIRY